MKILYLHLHCAHSFLAMRATILDNLKTSYFSAKYDNMLYKILIPVPELCISRLPEHFCGSCQHFSYSLWAIGNWEYLVITFSPMYTFHNFRFFNCSCFVTVGRSGPLNLLSVSQSKWTPGKELIKVPKFMEILIREHTATSAVDMMPHVFFRTCPQPHSLHQIPSRDTGSQGIPLI